MYLKQQLMTYLLSMPGTMEIFILLILIVILLGPVYSIIKSNWKKRNW